MRVLFVVSEAYPLAKTGGLGDVARALPIALTRLGVDVRLLMPAYPSALLRLNEARFERPVGNLLGVDGGRLISGKLPNSDVPVWLVDAPSLYRRPGGPYQDDTSRDWPDNALRFAYLSHVAAKLALNEFALDWRPDVVHANDWHTGLLPLLLAAAGENRPATVFTIHNLAFQGNFPMDMLDVILAGDGSSHRDTVEFYGQMSFLKAAIRHADRLTTVSPTYAKEALTPEFGCGMDGLLRERAADFTGILNGVEYGLWDPSCDPHLPCTYGPQDLSGKKICKAELQRAFALPIDPDVPVFGFVSRLVHQKMADTVLEALPGLVACGAQFVLVAQGDPALEAAFARAAEEFPSNVAVHIGYEEFQAHRVQGGADIVLAPSRFEPCGLTQLYALHYGTLPIVRRTGGSADTVIEAVRGSSGFVFAEATLDDLSGAIQRAMKLYRDPLAWRRTQLHAMTQDFSWDSSARKYLALYRDLTGLSAPSAIQSKDAEKLVAHAGM